MKQKAVIIDIDGTLGNTDHRRHFVDPSKNTEYYIVYEDADIPIIPQWYSRVNGERFKSDWESFNREMINDTPNGWCVELIDAFDKKNITHVDEECWYEYDDFKFIFVSGRKEVFKKITKKQIEEWLHIDEMKYKLFMRKNRDYRSDMDVKIEIYENHIKDQYDVLFCVDDRKCIVDLWRSLGLVCLDCAGYK